MQLGARVSGPYEVYLRDSFIALFGLLSVPCTDLMDT